MTIQLAHWCVMLLLAPGPSTGGQTAPQQATSPPQKSQSGAAKVTADDLPVSLERIQAALAHTPRLQFDEQDRPVFRVQVFGEKPTIDDILGPDWAKGPVKHGAMTHQEFLKLVTPEGARGYEAFSSGEGVTVATSSLLLQWTLQKALQKYRETKDEREREAARQEVLAALEALEKARAKAGLPRK